MKRCAALVLCFALLLLALPGPGYALDPPKTAFITNYMYYFDTSTRIQQVFYAALQQKTIRVSMDANLLSNNIILEDGTTLSNVPGRGSISMTFNLADKQAAVNFSGQISKYNLAGQVYLDDQGVIIPKETIKSLASNGMSFPELGDISQLPEFVIYPGEMDASGWKEIDQGLKMAEFSKSQQVEALKALFREILMTIPDQCYYYSGTDPVLDLARITLSSPELLDNLKKHSETLADKFVATMNKPDNMTTQEFLVMKAEMKKEIISGIKKLNADELAALAGDIPVTVSKFQIIAGADRCESIVALESNLPDNTRLAFTMKSTSKASANDISTLFYGDFSLNTNGLELDLQLNGDGKADTSKGSFNLSLSGKGEDPKNVISGRLGLNGSADWSGQNQVIIPYINQYNSIRIVRQPLPEPPIRVFLDGQELYFEHPAWINEGGTMIQVSEIVKTLGYDISWQPPDSVLISSGSGNDLKLILNSSKYYIGGQEYKMPGSPEIIDGRLYAPLRVLAQYGGLKIEWDAALRWVTLTRP